MPYKGQNLSNGGAVQVKAKAKASGFSIQAQAKGSRLRASARSRDGAHNKEAQFGQADDLRNIAAPLLRCW